MHCRVDWWLRNTVLRVPADPWSSQPAPAEDDVLDPDPPFVVRRALPAAGPRHSRRPALRGCVRVPAAQPGLQRATALRWESMVACGNVGSARDLVHFQNLFWECNALARRGSCSESLLRSESHRRALSP